MSRTYLFTVIALLALLSTTTPVGGRGDLIPAGQDEYQRIKERAEALYAEGSYRRALDLYKQAESLDLAEDDARWVAYRIGDSMWRNEAATSSNDNTIFERARTKLNDILQQYDTPSDRDDLWALIQESLGDFWWNRRNVRNWHQGWSHYQPALDYWGGSRDLDHARGQYLGIVFRATEPAWLNEYPYYRQYVQVPANILENATKIANTDQSRTHAQYLLAMAMRQQGGWRQQQRVGELFADVVASGRSSSWHDDALFYYAEWLSQQGVPRRLAGGQWRAEADFPKALKLYQALVRQYRKGETPYFDQAKNRITQITQPTLSLAVSNVFLPESEIQFQVNWRNIGNVSFTIHRVDLTRDVQFPAATITNTNWLDHVDLARATKMRSWERDTENTGDHRPRNDTITLKEKLEPGAYLVQATGGGQKARDILIVSRTAIVLKSVADQTLMYVCNAIDGSPLAGADVAVWELRYHRQKNNRWTWTAKRHTGTTNDDGLAAFDLSHPDGNGTLYAFAAKKDEQAFSMINAAASQPPGRQYRIYAYTDRPAYRPGDDVHWKITTRVYKDSIYTTPAGQTIKYKLIDPRGTAVEEDTLVLNQFGSAWSKLTLKDDAALGEYRVQFWTKKGNDYIGDAQLFRMEEYKLPEFQVTVSTPTDNDRRKMYQVGDTVEATIEARYYFGAPVAGADVEVVVYQRPYWYWWQQPRDYDWLYEDSNPYRWMYGGQGQQIKREMLKTDAEGIATITFDTPLNTNQDYEYTIEARVTDSSRREVIDSGIVRVTRQKYFVEAKPDHHIYRPKEDVTIRFHAADANKASVETEGLVEIFRDEWNEIWIAPDGREVTGDELTEVRKKYRRFPPSTKPGQPAWRLKYRGYKTEQILSRAITTDSQGAADLVFTPQQEGYYRVTWVSEENDFYPVTATAAVWICDTATRSIGYFHGGIDLVVDKDTFKTGEVAPVMISVPANNQYVLFTIEGGDLHDYRVIHVEGTVKLIHVPVNDEYIPNVWLQASMVRDGQLFSDMEEVVVPPVDHFLNIDVALDHDAYLPGDTGTLTVTATDADGNPVSAEIALAVADEAVYYIQQDLAPDPRQFFFSNRQSLRVATTASMYQKPFRRLGRNENEDIVDLSMRTDDDGRWRDDRKKDGLDSGGVRQRSFEERNQLGRLANAPAAAHALSQSAAKSSRLAGGFGGGGLMGDRAEESLSMPADVFAGEANKGDEPRVRVRSDFRATALWLPSVVTDDDGTASVDVKFPDSTSRWRATARAASTGSQFGIGTTSAKTRQPLIVRLQAPRFFVVNDYTTISAILNNNTDQEMLAKYAIEADGLELIAADIDGNDLSLKRPLPVSIPAQQSVRINWRVGVRESGEARIVVTARAGEHTDGMERTYTVYEHGIEKHITKAGKVRADDVTITLALPAARKDGSTVLRVQVTPSMAATMLDSLPYLIDYPYGCTEQTMSRFLPAAIVARTLNDLGIDADAAMNGVFGGIERAHTDATHPKGRKNLAKLDDMITRGLARLSDFQHADGGWGWWKQGDSDHYMSAYVVWGLSLAIDAKIEVDRNVLARGAEYLRNELVEEERAYDNQAWMLHALAAYHRVQRGNARPLQFERTAFDNLWKNRDRLNAYTRALLALTAHAYGRNEQAQTLIRNLENGVKIDASPDTSVVLRGPQRSQPAVIPTAHWGGDGVSYRWSQRGIEATAFALKALLTIAPEHELIEPVTNWLIKNRRGAQWSNTRDTAITVLALNDYLVVSGELQPNQEIEIIVNGTTVSRRTLTAKELFSGPTTITVNPELIRDGDNNIRIVRRSGEGPIYFAVDAEFFSQEEPIEPAGHEIFVRRDYYKLVPYPTLLNGYGFERLPMKDGDSVRSGERVEVVLTIESKNNYEYLVFEDLKPSGLEAVQIKSGKSLYARELKLGGIERRFGEETLDAIDIARDHTDYTGRQQWIYQELRDRHVALFIDHLPEGVWELSYEFRAEVPGEFHALPVLGHAMYVPEIRTNSREMRMTVYERAE